MGLVPADFPERLKRRGLKVSAFGDWYNAGGNADHKAIVLHHTASAASGSPASDAAYCHHGTSIAPLYNVLIGRDGSVWVLAREKSNSSGKISSRALQEAMAGKAGSVSAAARGLHDDTSANQNLFAIAYQNNGTGEKWSAAMLNAGNIVAAEALKALGLPHAGWVTQHRVLTARKIDCCGDACPQNFQPGINAAMAGKPPPTPPPPVPKPKEYAMGTVIPVQEAGKPVSAFRFLNYQNEIRTVSSQDVLILVNMGAELAGGSVNKGYSMAQVNQIAKSIGAKVV